MARSFTRIGDKFLRHRSCLNAQRQQDIPARATARALKIEAFSDALHVALEISLTGSGHPRRSVWASERKPKKLKPIGRARARVRESHRQNMRYNGTVDGAESGTLL